MDRALLMTTRIEGYFGRRVPCRSLAFTAIIYHCLRSAVSNHHKFLYLYIHNLSRREKSALRLDSKNIDCV